MNSPYIRSTPLFQEWADEIDRSVLLNEPGTCIVCGAPMNICTGEDHRMAEQDEDKKSAGRQASRRQAQEAADVSRGTGPLSGAVVRRNEGFDISKFSSEESGDRIIVPDEDVYEEFYPENSKRPSYRLLFPQGQPVRESDVTRRLGTVTTLRRTTTDASPEDAETTQTQPEQTQQSQPNEDPQGQARTADDDKSKSGKKSK